MDKEAALEAARRFIAANAMEVGFLARVGFVSQDDIDRTAAEHPDASLNGPCWVFHFEDDPDTDDICVHSSTGIMIVVDDRTGEAQAVTML